MNQSHNQNHASGRAMGLWRSLAVGVISVALLAACGESAQDLLSKAKQEMDRKEYRAAALHLKTALQKEPDLKEARYTLGVALREIGDLAAAEKELRRALELGHDPAQALPILARVVYSQGRLDDFIKEFNQAQFATPEDNADLQALLGNAAFSRGKQEDAVRHFDQALQLVPGHNPARVGQARLAAARQDIAGADKILGEVLTANPKDREALLTKSAVLLFKGDREGAIAVHRKLVEYYPEGVAEHYSLTTQLLEGGKSDEAKASSEALAKLAPNDPRTHHVQALLAYEARNYVQAQELAVKALARAPGFVPAQLVAGAASVQLRAYQQAIQYLTEVINVQKRNIFAYQLLVAAYMGAGETERASRVLKDAMAIFPNDAKLLLLAGEVAARDKKLPDAAKFFELSAEKGEDSGLASVRLGQALIAEGKDEEGLRVLEEASKADSKAQSDMMLVMYHLRRGEFDKAGKWVESLEKKHPASAMSPNLRGVIQLAKNDLPGARKHFEAALQRDGQSTAALSYLARMDLAEKKPADAKKRYEDALAKYPKVEGIAVDHARLLRGSGEKPEVIIAALNNFIKANPGAERARLLLIDNVLLSGERKKAMETAREALAAVPSSVPIKMALGRTQQAAGEHQQALATYAEIIALQPRSVPPLLYTAQVHEALGDHSKSLEALDKAQTLSPENYEIKRSKVVVLLRNKQEERALKVAQEIRKQMPKAAIGYEVEAGVLVAMNRWAEAAEVLQGAYRDNPTSQMAVKLHAALSAGGKKDRAMLLATDWMSKNPKDLGMRTYLADRALREQDAATAIRLYKEALTVQPANPALLNNLAWASAQINDPQAIKYAEDAHKLDPNSAAIQDTFGWLLVQKGDVARGLPLLEQAAKSAPSVLTIRYNLARALVKAGRKDDARKELEFLKSQGSKFVNQGDVDTLLKQL